MGGQFAPAAEAQFAPAADPQFAAAAEAQFAAAAEAQFAPAAEAQFAPVAEAARSASPEVTELVAAVRAASRDDRFDHILRLIEADFGESS